MLGVCVLVVAAGIGLRGQAPAIRAGEIRVAASVPRVDLSGKTVMPMLVGTHVHSGFQQGLSYSAANCTRETVVSDLGSRTITSASPNNWSCWKTPRPGSW